MPHTSTTLRESRSPARLTQVNLSAESTSSLELTLVTVVLHRKAARAVSERGHIAASILTTDRRNGAECSDLCDPKGY